MARRNLRSPAVMLRQDFTDDNLKERRQLERFERSSPQQN